MPVKYPPEYVFPRNPVISDWITPIYVKERYIEGADNLESRLGKPLSAKKNSLDFVTGVDGTVNTIELSHSPYIDYKKYSYEDNAFLIPPIEIVIDIGQSTSQIYKFKDITNYVRKEVVVFSHQATGLYDDVEFYFDGRRIVTNYNFASSLDRKKIEVRYTKLIDSIRVKAVLLSNFPGEVYKTPAIDQYTLVVGRQKGLR